MTCVFGTGAPLPGYFFGQCDTGLLAMESYTDVTRSFTSFVPFHPLSALRTSSIEIYRPHIDSFNRGKVTEKSWALSNIKSLLDAVVYLRILRLKKSFPVK